MNKDAIEAPNMPDVTIHSQETFSGWPDACRLRNGDILVVFREDSIHNISETGKVVCVRSRDNGLNWEDPVVICDYPGEDNRDPRILQASDGTIWVGVCSQRPENYRAHLVRSFDNGKTWEEPIIISDPDYFPTWPALEMSNGEILWIGGTNPRVKLPSGKTVWTAGTPKCKRCTFVAREEGGHFKWTPFVHPDLGLANEWMVAETTSGHLIAILRQGPSEYYYQSWSKDYGRSWEPALPTTIWQSEVNSRPMVYKLTENTLIIAYAERARHRIVAIPSFDGGITWRNDRIVTILDNETHCGSKHCDFGYTACVKAGADKYLFVYYAYPGYYSPHKKGIFGNFVETERFEP